MVVLEEECDILRNMFIMLSKGNHLGDSNQL
jgi:hypothetical protein